LSHTEKFSFDFDIKPPSLVWQGIHDTVTILFTSSGIDETGFVLSWAEARRLKKHNPRIKETGTNIVNDVNLNLFIAL
jgi:hypothetical protein